MNVHELSRDQLVELKQAYLCEIADPRCCESPSYGELALTDELVTDAEIFERWEGTDFVPDDFLCYC